MSELLSLLWAPFLMCLVLTGIHAYLGLHVLAREIVFVDIALAQIAALGATAALIAGYDLESWASYFSALTATLLGALVLSLTRTRERRVSQEAIIGTVYAVSAAAAVLLAAGAPHGTEHIRAMLVGSILTVSGREVLAVALLYAAVGAVHWACRRPFFLISSDPEAAFREGWRVRLWDFLFYATFGLVVTSSVRIAGVLLVFSYLIVPALAATALTGAVATRLVIGWSFGAAVSLGGVAASAVFDLPTGATVVCAFGVTLFLGWALVHATGGTCPWAGPPEKGSEAGGNRRAPHTIGTMTSARARALLVAAGGAFVVLALAVVLMETLPLDAELRALLLGWASPAVVRVMRVINYGGDWRVLLPGTLLLLWLSARARAQWWVWVALMVAAPLTEWTMKQVIGRARPEDLSMGFPSGHATAAGAFCGAVLYLAEAIPGRGLRRVVRLAALVGALLVGVARVMLRAHWPSDALAGVALGLALASVAALIASAQAPLRGR